SFRAGKRGVGQEETDAALGDASQPRVGGEEDGGEGRGSLCLANALRVVREEVHPRTREEHGRKHHERVFDCLYHIPNNIPTKNLSGNCGCFYRLPALSLEILESQLMKLILKFATKRRRTERPPPLLIEVFEETNGALIEEYGVFPFTYSLRRMLKG